MATAQSMPSLEQRRVRAWQLRPSRRTEKFCDKGSLSDDKDLLKKLDPYLRSLKLDAIDMSVLQRFIRDRKLKMMSRTRRSIAHSRWFGGY